MDRIDCDLAQGRHEHVLGELQVLVREHPLRERLRAQQMLALYRADRQADALDAYQQARHALVDELGIEPSESLQRLQQAILRHDPALERPAGTAAVNGTASPWRGSPRRVAPRRGVATRLRRRRVLAAALAARGRLPRRSPCLPTTAAVTRPPRSLPAVLPEQPRPHRPGHRQPRLRIAAGIEPGPMAFSGDTAWVVNRGDRTISRYDVRSAERREAFRGRDRPVRHRGRRAGNAWVSDRGPTVNWILHPANGIGTAAVPLGTDGHPRAACGRGRGGVRRRLPVGDLRAAHRAPATTASR